MLLCLVLASLDETPGQTTLKRVSDAVAASSHDLRLEPFDPLRYAERRALVDVLRLLDAFGIIRQRDGDAGRYARSGEGDALYDIDDRRLAQLIAAPSAPSFVDRPDDLPAELYPETDEGMWRRARHRVMRRLLDDPVLYYDDLDERERDWLAHSLRFVHDILNRDVGLVVERRAEGAIAVDPARELTDVTFPDGGSTVKHTALLLAEQLTARARSARGAGPAVIVVGDDDVIALTAELMASYGDRCGWSATYMADKSGAACLAADAMALLHGFGLVARDAGGWRPCPAIARFAPAAPGDRRSEAGHGRRRRDGHPTLLDEVSR